GDWLVGMSGKDNGPIRVGCGRYDWYFTADEQCLVDRLKITIEVMQILDADECDAVMNWLSSLPYPWCTVDEAARNMPKTEALTAVGEYLKAVRPISPDR